MGILRALVLAGVVALAGAQAARSADLLPPPPPLEPFAPTPDYSGWYLRGDVGVGIAHLGKMSSTLPPNFFVPDYRFDNSSLQDAAIVGIGVGYQFNAWLRGDVTGEYRSSQVYNASTSFTNFIPAGGAAICGDLVANPRCEDFYHGSVQSSVFLANGYADLGTWFGLTPFVGAGVGASFNHFGSIYDNSVGNTGGGVSSAVTHTSLAWALMAGVDWTVSPNLKLELGYRYLNLGHGSAAPIICQNNQGCGEEIQNFKLASQDVRLGMRWMFNAPEAPPEPAPPPAPPIVTKY